MSKKNFLGVDIGTSTIKLVELADKNGQPSLVTYGFAEIQTDLVRSNSPATVEKVAQVLKALVKKARVSTDRSIAALPTFAVFNSIISLPKMSRKDLSSAVRWEAKKFIPLPIDEMILDWKVLADSKKNILPDGMFSKDLGNLLHRREDDDENQTEEEKEAKAQKESMKEQRVLAKASKKQAKDNIRVLLTAAPKSLVSKYIEVFKKAGLNLLSLETEAFALARSLIGNDQTTTMIVDIGSLSTDIVIIEKGVPILNRGIDIGGYTITKAIMDSLNVSFDRAEQFKIDFGVMLEDQTKGVPKTIVDSLQPIINEIKYVFDLYQNQGSMRVEKIVLSGGSAFMPNLPEYLVDLLKIQTIIGNPWDRVVYPLDIKPVLDGVAPQMAAVIGLAMRDIE